MGPVTVDVTEDADLDGKFADQIREAIFIGELVHWRVMHQQQEMAMPVTTGCGQ